MRAQLIALRADAQLAARPDEGGTVDVFDDVRANYAITLVQGEPDVVYAQD